LNGYLSVKQVSELNGYSERYIRKMIANGSIESVMSDNKHMIPFTGLPLNLQRKYMRKTRSGIAETQKSVAAEFDFESVSAKEREEIIYWIDLLAEWRSYRAACGLSKSEAEVRFVDSYNDRRPEKRLSVRTLYRKQKALRDGDMSALRDGRAANGGGACKITEFIWDIFLRHYLTGNNRKVHLCMTLVEEELKELSAKGLIAEKPRLPSLRAFELKVKTIPEPVMLYFRGGIKKYKDRAEPYIARMYDDLEPNDIWVADNHTFDIMIWNGVSAFRPHLTGFMDARTRKFTGWCITDNPCADATIYALRRGVSSNGIPNMIYGDNGREFLFHDFGQGFRKRKKNGDANQPTILKHLGIEFRAALPRNARAKGIERAFGTICENFSKVFESYTGNSVETKPDALKTVLKKPDKMLTVEEFKLIVDDWINGYYNNRPHIGEGMRGKSPNEAFECLLIEKRVATQSQLNLMFMRCSRKLKVLKNGVTLRVYGKNLQYIPDTESDWMQLFGHYVYVRYDPDDLSAVRIYDEKELFMCTAQLLEKLSYNATADEISKAQADRRRITSAVAAYKKQNDIKTSDALELAMHNARRNLDRESTGDYVIIPMFVTDETVPEIGCAVKNGNSDALRAPNIDNEKLRLNYVGANALDWEAGLFELKERRQKASLCPN